MECCAFSKIYLTFQFKKFDQKSDYCEMKLFQNRMQDATIALLEEIPLFKVINSDVVDMSQALLDFSLVT